MGHDLADAGPAFAVAGAAGGAGKHQRNHFAREAIDGALIGAAHADAQLDLRRIGMIRGRPRRRAVAGIHAEVFSIDFVEAQPQLVEALARAGTDVHVTPTRTSGLEGTASTPPLHVFGVSHLAPDVLDALRAVSLNRQVHLYFPYPRREHWRNMPRNRDPLFR